MSFADDKTPARVVEIARAAIEHPRRFLATRVSDAAAEALLSPVYRTDDAVRIAGLG